MTGLFTWEYLYELGLRQDALWADYLAELKGRQNPRPDESVVKLML
jgi:DUF971 family protein